MNNYEIAAASFRGMADQPSQQDCARKAQLVALFDQLDERGQVTTLALLATAVKLHPKAPK